MHWLMIPVHIEISSWSAAPIQLWLIVKRKLFNLLKWPIGLVTAQWWHLIIAICCGAIISCSRGSKWRLMTAVVVESGELSHYISDSIDLCNMYAGVDSSRSSHCTNHCWGSIHSYKILPKQLSTAWSISGICGNIGWQQDCFRAEPLARSLR